METSSVDYYNHNNNTTTTDIDSSTKVKYRSYKKKKKYIPNFACFKSNNIIDRRRSFDMESLSADRNPTHLVVTVNGIIGSAQDWRFAAKQLLNKYPNDVIVHCSECNSSVLTFDGVDIMGDRLADEVISVVKRHPDVRKISFIGHSLGGLVARYAIAKLYTKESTKPDEDGKLDESEKCCNGEESKGKIAGLEPINFITSATPHFGCRGHKQVPAFCGFYALEKVAFSASWCLGRTGKHLFLADSDDGKPPLLLQMASDCEDLPFISALQSFKRRVAYANRRYDYLVAWSTSSLRRRSELPKRRNFTRNEKYPHIVNVEAASREDASMHAKVNGNQSDCDIDMEEAIIRGLTRLSWERVDVSFSGSTQRYMAHSTIQVKTYWMHSDGADVIQHMVDNFLL